MKKRRDITVGWLYILLAATGFFGLVLFGGKSQAFVIKGGASSTNSRNVTLGGYSVALGCTSVMAAENWANSQIQLLSCTQTIA